MTRRVAIVLAVGLVAIGLTTAIVLARSPLVVAGTNSVTEHQYVELTDKRALASCQQTGTIPRDTTAVAVGAEGTFFSPAITLKIFAANRLIDEGHAIAGGVSAPTVLVAVKRLSHAVAGARICTTVGPAVEPIRYYGLPQHAPGKSTGPLQEVKLEMRYLRPGPNPWLSLVPAIFRHLGIARAPSGTWVSYLLVALMLAIVVLAARLTLRELP